MFIFISMPTTTSILISTSHLFRSVQSYPSREPKFLLFAPLSLLPYVLFRFVLSSCLSIQHGLADQVSLSLTPSPCSSFLVSKRVKNIDVTDSIETVSIKQEPRNQSQKTDDQLCSVLFCFILFALSESESESQSHQQQQQPLSNNASPACE